LVVEDVIGSKCVHEVGLNFRHMGHVRYLMTDPSARKLVLSMAVMRLAKNEIRALMRETMNEWELSTTSDVPFREIFMNYANNILNETNGAFWNHDLKKKLDTRFPSLLSPAESQPTFSLYPEVDIRFAVVKLLHFFNVDLSDKALHTFMKKPKAFSFVLTDLKSMDIKSKHIHVVRFCAAMQYYLQGKELLDAVKGAPPLEKKKNKRAALRLLKESCEMFEQLISKIPHCPVAPCRLGCVYIEFARAYHTPAKKYRYYQKVIELCKRSIHNLPTPFGYKDWANILERMARLKESEGFLEEAEVLHQQARDKLDLIPTVPKPFQTLTTYLSFFADHTTALSPIETTA